VQPLYLRAEGGKIPELKRVVVAHENRVAMGETLEEGLSLLFWRWSAVRAQHRSHGPDSTRAGGRRDQPEPARRGRLGRARRSSTTTARSPAQRSGDWATYGRERSISWAQCSTSYAPRKP